MLLPTPAGLLQGGSQAHYLLGLRILNMLVSEMNSPTVGRSLTQHRKIAVNFRDASLYKVFQLALAALRHLHGTAADEKLKEQVGGAGGVGQGVAQAGRQARPTQESASDAIFL